MIDKLIGKNMFNIKLNFDILYDRISVMCFKPFDNEMVHVSIDMSSIKKEYFDSLTPKYFANEVMTHLLDQLLGGIVGMRPEERFYQYYDKKSEIFKEYFDSNSCSELFDKLTIYFKKKKNEI